MISFASIKNHHHHHPLLFCASPSNYNLHTRRLQICSLSSVAPLEAMLFDIDGTLRDSDPLHLYAFREMLRTPITEEFFIENISGRHNEDLCHILLSDWEIQRSRKFMEDQEAMFQRACKSCANGSRIAGLRRAAVTNAPISDAELLASMLGLSDSFEILVIGNECDRAKPFPDPYLKALQTPDISHKHAFDSVSGMAAGMPVVGLGTRNPEQLLTEATFVV
ncbi:hypothetical protein POPTR_002G135000v4 [Populus trichocarpa]|uniref:Uncharacterized protein n=1 Tax=Populus trichocarpa TaxID=3694 RepID=A0ACC0TDV1_POPTR|nr:hypothetical protein POPTR_002G135000v4 [Populus trichocarpa]